MPTTNLASVVEDNKAVQTVSILNNVGASDLTNWLENQENYIVLEKAAIDKVEDWIVQLIAGIKKLKSKAPGKSQWGQLRDMATKAEKFEDFGSLLLTGEKAVCATGISKRIWEEKFYLEDAKKKISFAEFIKDYVLTLGVNKEEVLKLCVNDNKEYKLFLTRQLLYRLGNRLPHVLNQEGL
jgi:hypothetical protein